MLLSNTDIIITLIFSFGLVQFFWLSAALVKRGMTPSFVRLCLLPLLAIWVLAWPAYENTFMPLASLSLLVIPFLITLQKTALSKNLKLAWHTTPEQIKQPTPWLMLTISFVLCAAFFDYAPELGLGVALSLCLAWSAAELIDKTGRGVKLGLARNPFQTLAGHLVLVFGTSFTCVWSLQLYHGIDWSQFYIATLIAGLATSIIRALSPQGWNMPLSILGMSLTLWLL